MRCRQTCAAALSTAVLVMWGCFPVWAFDLTPREVLGFGYLSIEGEIQPVVFPMNSIDNTQVLVNLDDPHATIRDVVINTRGDLLLWGDGGLTRVNHENGERTPVSFPDDYGLFPNRLAVASNGDLLFSGNGYFEDPKLIRVDPCTGEQQIVIAAAAFGEKNFQVHGVIATKEGRIFLYGVGLEEPYVSNFILVTPSSIIEVTPGQEHGWKLVASLDHGIQDMYLDVNGDLIALTDSHGLNSLVRVNPNSGVQSIIASGELFFGVGEELLAVTPEGHYILYKGRGGDFFLEYSAYDVDPATGTSTQIFRDRRMNVWGAVVVPPAEVGQGRVRSCEDDGPGPIEDQILNIVDAMDCREGAEVTKDPEQLATCGRDVKAIAADGVAKLLLRFNAEGPGMVTFSRPPNGSAEEEGILRSIDETQTGESVTVETIATSAGEKAFVIYEAPLDFAWSPEQACLTKRDILLRAEIAGTREPMPVERSISIVRPPVILVHGLWAAPGDWKNFTSLINNSRFSVGPPADDGGGVNYGYGLERVVTTDPIYRETKPPGEPIRNVSWHALGLRYNAEKHVFPQSKKYLEDFRNSSNPLSIPAAAIQADFVAHSMGGLVARTLPLLPDFLSDNTFGRGIIHKLITIGTPHLGTPLASQLLQDVNQCIREKVFGLLKYYSFRSVVLSPTRERVNGAVFDLQGDGKPGGFVSEAIANLQNSPVKIPTMMIGGEMTAAQLKGLDCEFELLNPLGCVPAIIEDLCGDGLFNVGSPLLTHFTSQGWPDILGGASDGIVPLTSQFNGLNPIDVGNYIFPAVHSKGTNNIGFPGNNLQEEASDVPKAVIELLNKPVIYYIHLPQ